MTPTAAIMIWASAAQRSRLIESEISVIAFGVRWSTTAAKTPAVTKPAPVTVAQHGRDPAQRVHRGEHHRRGSDRRVAPALPEDAGEDQELTGEVRRAGHGEREHPGHEEQRREDRPTLRRAAQLREDPGPPLP